MIETITTINQQLLYAKNDIIKPAKGKLQHDYLVPAGPYSEQWDWDAFFMCIALVAEDVSNAKYLKNWVLNYLENSAPDGSIAGCVTPLGPDPRLKQIKPLIAQGAALACIYLNDFEWIRSHLATLQTVVEYRFDNMWSNKYGLAVWFDAMESGIDNNLAALNFPNLSVAGVDVNSFMHAECVSLAFIAQNLGDTSLANNFSERAYNLHTAMNRYLWDKKDGMFYNLNVENGELIRCISCSNFFPLTYNIASNNQAKLLIEKYLLNPDHMRSKYGLRTISKQDKGFNNTKMIKPHSNWQGPIWPIMTYLYCIGLSQYGYKNQAIDIATSVISLVNKDINQTGGMHENYNSETGESLAAPYFVSWNLLLGNVLEDIHFNRNPLNVSDSFLQEKIRKHLINRSNLKYSESSHNKTVLPVLTGHQRYTIMQRFISQMRAARLGESSVFSSTLEHRFNNLPHWDSVVMFNFSTVNAEFFETNNLWWNVQLFNFNFVECLPETPIILKDLNSLVTPFTFETSPDFLVDRFNWYARKEGFVEVASLSDLFICSNNATASGNEFALLLINRSAYLLAIVIASLYLYRCKTTITFVCSGFSFEKNSQYLAKIQVALDMLGVDPVNVIFE